MEKKLFIHLGYPKTGTSYLQDLVFTQLHQHKKINFIERESIFDLLRRIAYQDEFSFNYEQVKAEISSRLREGINIISHEQLVGAYFYKFSNSKLIADRLQQLFPTATILLTIRNQYDLLMSLYRQFIHEGGSLRLYDFLNYDNGEFKASYLFDDHKLNIEQFNYSNLINYYRQLFGNENVKVIPYEALRKDQANFLQTIFDILQLNVPTSLTFENKVVNKGYGKNQIRLARFFNHFLVSHFNRYTPAHLLKFNRKSKYGAFNIFQLKRLLQSSLSFKILGDKKLKDEELKKVIKARFKADNLILDASINGQLTSDFSAYYF